MDMAQVSASTFVATSLEQPANGSKQLPDGPGFVRRMLRHWPHALLGVRHGGGPRELLVPGTAFGLEGYFTVRSNTLPLTPA